jgi:urea transport system permease protein
VVRVGDGGRAAGAAGAGVRHETGFGGNNGLTDFKHIAGFSLHDQRTKVGLFVISAAALLAGYLICRYVVTSRLGRVLVAVRDREARVRFLGYSPLRFKLFVWVLSAALCGVAGALYVPQVGIINPGELHPAVGIEIAIWVAVGGRGTLVGAIVGALAINAGKSWLTAAYPESWLFVLGTLFIVVTRFFPEGILRSAARAGSAAWARARRRTALRREETIS